MLRNIIVGVVVENTFLWEQTQKREATEGHISPLLQHVPAEVERCQAEHGPADKARGTPTLQGVKFHRFTNWTLFEHAFFEVFVGSPG